MKKLSSEEIQRKNEEAARRAELNCLAPISFQELEKIVNQWMLVVDQGIIKLLPALIIANKLHGRDPVWLFLIGPSGGGKTEFLSCLFDLQEVWTISLLTAQTFLSGMPGEGDMSLLPKINNKVLIFKDWTNILSQNKDARNEIMGQLREIYDGQMKKPFGNGKIAEWKGKIGLIAGTTPAIDIAQQMHTTLGERFIHYRLKTPGRKETAQRALSNSENAEFMRTSLRNAFYAFFKGVEIPAEIPKVSDEVQTEIIKVANFTTMARSGVIREFTFKKEIMFVPSIEMPTRIVQQLNSLAVSFIIVNKGEFIPEDMKIIYKIALDSIPQTNRMVIMEMARSNERTTTEIATSLGYPTGPIRLYLENLAMLGVCRRIKGRESEEGGTADKWIMEPEFVEIIRTYEGVKAEESVLEIEDIPVNGEEEIQAQNLGLGE